MEAIATSDSRLLLSMKTFIGDAVMTLPLIEELQEQFPSRGVITSPEILQIFPKQKHPWALSPFVKQRGPLALLRQVKAIREQNFDIAVLVNRSFRSALVARMAGIPRRIGHVSEARKFLLTDSLPYHPALFEAETVSQLVRPLDLEVRDPRPKILISKQESELSQELLQGATVGVQPGARFSSRQLPVEVVIHLCKELQVRGFKVAFLGGKTEKSLANSIAQSLNFETVNLVGKTELRQTVSCLSNLRAVFGSDTGLLHLSAAVGTPTLQVFAKADPRRWAHQYPPHRFLVAPEGQMQNLQSQTVVEEAMRLLGEQ